MVILLGVVIVLLIILLVSGVCVSAAQNLRLTEINDKLTSLLAHNTRMDTVRSGWKTSPGRELLRARLAARLKDH